MKKAIAVIGLMLCVAPSARAQGGPTRDSAITQKVQDALKALQAQLDRNEKANAGADPFARYFFPPELVMAHQQEINLTDRQRSAIQEAMKSAQGSFIDLQFKMSAEAQKLQRLIQGPSIDEAKVLEQVDRVLSLEREIKRAQISLMVRIKNQLTADQQTLLGKMRKDADD